MGNSSWQDKPLSEIAEIVGGGTPRTNISSYWNGDIVWLSPTDLPPIGEIVHISDSKNKITNLGLEQSSARLLPQGSIVFSSRASIGKIGIADVELCTNQGFTNFICDSSVYNKFLAYALKKYTPEISALSNSTTFAEVSKTNLKRFVIPLPRLPEQRRIVAKLDSLFERIDKAIALVEENIKNARSLMASVLNEVFDGVDCDRVRLQDACIINPPKSEVKDLGNTEVSFLPMADLNAHQINFIPKHTKQVAEVYAGYTYFKDGDVLLAKVTPCFENGKAGLADNLVNGIGFGSSEYYVLRAKQTILPAYVYYNLASSGFLRQGAQNMSGAVGLKRVTKDFLFNYEIPVPSIEVQENVVKYFGNQKAKLSLLTDRLEERLTELKKLKSSLLDAAFRGEL